MSGGAISLTHCRCRNIHFYQVGHRHAYRAGEVPCAYQADSAEEVVIEAHQMDLTHCCQRLLLGELAGARAQAQPLCSHTNCAAADNDYPAAGFPLFRNAI